MIPHIQLSWLSASGYSSNNLLVQRFDIFLTFASPITDSAIIIIIGSIQSIIANSNACIPRVYNIKISVSAMSKVHEQ